LEAIIFPRGEAHGFPSALLIVIVAGFLGSSRIVSMILEFHLAKRAKRQTLNVLARSVSPNGTTSTADLAMPGCTVAIGLGQYHFADARDSLTLLGLHGQKLSWHRPCTIYGQFARRADFHLRIPKATVQDLILDPIASFT